MTNATSSTLNGIFGFPLIRIKQLELPAVDIAVTLTTSALLTLAVNCIYLQQVSATPVNEAQTQSQDLPSTRAADLGQALIQCGTVFGEVGAAQDESAELTELPLSVSTDDTPTDPIPVPELPPIANTQPIRPELASSAPTCAAGPVEPILQPVLPTIELFVDSSETCKQDDFVTLICLPIDFQ